MSDRYGSFHRSIYERNRAIYGDRIAGIGFHISHHPTTALIVTPVPVGRAKRAPGRHHVPEKNIWAEHIRLPSGSPKSRIQIIDESENIIRSQNPLSIEETLIHLQSQPNQSSTRQTHQDWLSQMIIGNTLLNPESKKQLLQQLLTQREIIVDKWKRFSGAIQSP
jgi:hypothetical protein